MKIELKSTLTALLLACALVACENAGSTGTAEESGAEEAAKQKLRPETFDLDRRNVEPSISGKQAAFSAATSHPYAGRTDTTWSIQQPGAAAISVHFKGFITERNYDFVYLYDRNNTLKKVYHGFLGDFWSEPIDGDSLKIRFLSDLTVNKNGFDVDAYAYSEGGAVSEYVWSEEANTTESAHDYAPKTGAAWVVKKAGAKRLKLHFSDFETEAGYDAVRIFDGTGHLVETLSGYQAGLGGGKPGFWSAEIGGDTARIELSSDDRNQKYGFKISQLSYALDGSQGQVVRIQGKSKYPVVLHHGFIGFDDVLKIDYFYKVRSTLEAAGYVVFTTEVSAVNTIAFRGKQLKRQILDVLQTTGAAKVNVIAHSQGGLDARYAISTLGLGDKIASLSTISTPHRGISAADVALKILPGFAESIFNVFLNLFASVYNQATAFAEANTLGALYDMTRENMVDNFNPANPNDARVFYQSWAGKSSITSIGTGDFLDPLLYASYAILKVTEGASDGLVGVGSAQWGNFRGTIPADHIDEVGHLFGTTANGYNHREFYKNICDELTTAGF